MRQRQSSLEPHAGGAHLDPQFGERDRGKPSRSPGDQFSRQQCFLPGEEGAPQQGDDKPESAELPLDATRPSDDAPLDGFGDPSPSHNDPANEAVAALVPSMPSEAPEERRKAAGVAAETCQGPQKREHCGISFCDHRPCPGAGLRPRLWPFDRYLRQLLRDAGDPADPIERMMIEQIALVHHKIGELYYRSASCEQPGKSQSL